MGGDVQKLVRIGGSGVVTFESRVMSVFEGRTFSEHTRRAYRKAVGDFFSFARGMQPAEVDTELVQRWRDHLVGGGALSNATINMRLSALRSFFDYLKDGGYVERNPAKSKLVQSLPLKDEVHGRALSTKEVLILLSGPDRAQAEGARDYAMMLMMLMTSLRAAEICSLRVSSIKWSHGRWVVRYRVKRGREMTGVVTAEMKEAVDDYLKLDRRRRDVLKSGSADAYLFQPSVNNRTLEFFRPITTRMLYYVVTKWADFGRLGKVTPHDLRRTAITRALDQGMSYRQVQMMTGHQDPKTVMRYDHGRGKLDLHPTNFLSYRNEG